MAVVKTALNIGELLLKLQLKISISEHVHLSALILFGRLVEPRRANAQSLFIHPNVDGWTAQGR
jgi:hypothetical protein